MLKSVLSLALLVSVFYAIGQDATINGRVLEHTNQEGLYGVNVHIKGTTNGTSTIDDGSYQLIVSPGEHSIEYSFIGFNKQTRKIKVQAGEKLTIDVSLKEAATEMDVFVVTGSKYKKKLGEEIISMEVLKQESINNTNFKLDDALNRVPGFNMLGESPSIRGGNGFAAGAASRVLFLLDGLPVLRPDNGEVFYEILPLENIQQVEIIKGASSALYGSAAMNGIVNVITANPRNEPVTKFIANYGFYQKFGEEEYTNWWDSRVRAFGEGALVHMKKFRNFDISVGANYFQDRNYLQEAQRKRARANFRLRYFPKKVENLTVGLNGNLLHQSGGSFFIWAGNDSLILRPREVATDLARTINFDPYAIYFDKKDNQHSLKTRIFNVFHESSEGARANTTQYLAEYTFVKQYETGWNIAAGATGYYTNTTSLTFGDHTASNAAAFVQIDKKFFERWTLSGGLRVEYFSVDTLATENEIRLITKDDGSHPTIPVKPVVRFGTNFQITETTFLRGSFAQAYRFPTIAELYVNTPRSGTFTYPNPDLVPETGWNAEIGIKQQFKISNWIAYVDVAGFITKYRDMMEFTFGNWGTFSDPDFGFGFRANNVGNAKISGFEVSSFGQGSIFGLPLNYMVGYTYIDPKNLDYDPTQETTSDNNPILKYRMKHSAKANFEVTYKKLVFGVNGFYNSFMENVDDFITVLDGVVPYRKENFGGDLVLDTKLGYQFSDQARVSVIVKNILNEDYTLRPAVMEAPRNYTFQVVYQY